MKDKVKAFRESLTSDQMDRLREVLPDSTFDFFEKTISEDSWASGDRSGDVERLVELLTADPVLMIVKVRPIFSSRQEELLTEIFNEV
jgi:hypothetical protein